jgi:hypothetical protein
VIFLFTNLAYNREVGNGDSPFFKLIEIYNNSQEGFAETLLDHESIKEEYFKYFMDMALPSMSLMGDVKMMMGLNTLSENVYVAEETMAYLVYENLVTRWIYQYKREYESATFQKIMGEDGKEQFPDTKYQRKIKTRKDGAPSAGPWLDSGKKRFNTIYRLIKEKRNQRMIFEERLMGMYSEEEQEAPKKGVKRKTTEEIIIENSKRVYCCNDLDLTAI